MKTLEDNEKGLDGAFSGHCLTTRRFVASSTLYPGEDINVMDVVTWTVAASSK